MPSAIRWRDFFFGKHLGSGLQKDLTKQVFEQIMYSTYISAVGFAAGWGHGRLVCYKLAVPARVTSLFLYLACVYNSYVFKDPACFCNIEYVRMFRVCS